MEHLVEVSYQIHRLTLVDVPDERSHQDDRAVDLDVRVGGRYRCRLRGVVSRTDLIRWRQTHIAEAQFVALVARCAAVRFKTEAMTEPRSLRAGSCTTVTCGSDLYGLSELLVLPSAGAAVLRFTSEG